jgi:hypothetical protein
MSAFVVGHHGTLTTADGVAVVRPGEDGGTVTVSSGMGGVVTVVNVGSSVEAEEVRLTCAGQNRRMTMRVLTLE